MPTQTQATIFASKYLECQKQLKNEREKHHVNDGPALGVCIHIRHFFGCGVLFYYFKMLNFIKLVNFHDRRTMPFSLLGG